MSRFIVSILLLPMFSMADMEVGSVQFVKNEGEGGVHWLGLKFKISPGWHLYWKNPGDSGMPVKIEWKLPPAVEVSDIYWPTPERIAVKKLMNFGYLNGVILPLKLSGQIRPNTSVTAAISWLVCKEVCVPGRATLKESFSKIPVSKDLRRVVAKLPTPLEAEASATWDPQEIHLRVEGLSGFGALFFPDEKNVLEHAAPQRVLPDAKGMTLHLKRSDVLPEPPRRLTGLLVVEGRSFRVDVPFVQDTIPKKR